MDADCFCLVFFRISRLAGPCDRHPVCRHSTRGDLCRDRDIQETKSKGRTQDSLQRSCNEDRSLRTESCKYQDHSQDDIL